ncbi:MAG: response regulator transcription factor [Roseburia sp.]|nr:response regulator transcription factor [Roseburia sp.]
MNYNCLIVDDEHVLADSTAEYFNLFGVATAAVYGAEECRAFFKDSSADLVLLDINMSDGSGFSLCKELRERTDIPILFISARGGDDDKLMALGIGGDDYIEKPYSLAVLLAKVKAVLKRCRTDSDTLFSDGRLLVDIRRKQVQVDGRAVKLTALEFKLLAYLAERRGAVVSKNELFEKVWQDRFTGDGTLNVHIRKLREAIELNPNSPKYIETVWGDGYKFTGDGL